MRRTIVTLTVALATVACSSDFTPYNEVASLRVLAMRAEPAWPAPGETTTLDALVVSPSGAAVSYAWQWCPLVGSASAGYPCLIDEASLRMALDEQVAGSGAALPAYDLGSEPTAALPHVVAPEVWQGVCALLRTQGAQAFAVDCETAFPITVLLTVTTSGEEVRAKKSVRLRYGADGEANANPTVSGLVLEQAAGPVTLDELGTVAVAADADVELRVELTEAAAETFTAADGSAARERLLFTWFIEAGKTDAERTTFIDGEVPLDEAARNTWTTPVADALTTNPTTVWVVAHDSRGGVAWTSGRATVEVAP